MPPELRAWMRPDDLMLYQLDQLPWPAYIRLVERYFEEHAFRIKRLTSESNRTEFLLVSKAGARHLLHCCSVQAAQRIAALELLRNHMARSDIQAGVLASPKDFSMAVVGAAHDTDVELYSGNRLRAKIEIMAPDQRRAILDSIRSKRDLDGAEHSGSWLSDPGSTGRSTPE